MEVSSRPKSNSTLQRSLSPSGRFCSSSISSSSSAFASSISGFSSRQSGFFTRPTSPTRVNLRGSASSSPSVRFSIDLPPSPSRSIAVNGNPSSKPVSGQKKLCMCSPTTHPGSFRCSLHKNNGNRPVQQHQQTATYNSNRLNAHRSAMKNSLVRIGTVEGELVKRALTALIRPSSHQQRRRADFQPRPSRLSIMSKADD
ncbi:hypothetical protein NMG60_11002770 [Bertholletia excelsa]